MNLDLAINPLIAIGVLASTAITDAAYVFFTSAVIARHRYRAANWSATWYLLSLSVGLLYAAGSFALAIFVFVLETLVTLLQAFIFTTLTATYIASSVEPAH